MIRWAQGLIRAAARLGDATRWPSAFVEGVAPWVLATYQLGSDRGDTERRVFVAGSDRAAVAGERTTWGIVHPTRELELVGLTLFADIITEICLTTAVASFAALYGTGANVAVAVGLGTDPASGVAQPGVEVRVGTRGAASGIAGTPQVGVGARQALWLDTEGLILPANRLLGVSFNRVSIGGTCGFWFRELGP